MDNCSQAARYPVDNVDKSVDNSVDNFLAVRIQNNYFILVVINRFINMWITCVIVDLNLYEGLRTAIIGIATCVEKKIALKIKTDKI